MLFYIGLHQPSDAKHFDKCMISINRLVNRKSNFIVKEWILDSGAFTQINKLGEFKQTEKEYTEQINRWASVGNLVAAVSQDYMCEPFVLDKTGLTVKEHQEKTIERYIKIKEKTDVYIMPVLQGYTVEEYLSHLEMYGPLLKLGSWVGVGSICKRNSKPKEILPILQSIKDGRPDLKLHGFGVKTTALKNKDTYNLLYSADSMAWSFNARKYGKQNDWREAKKFEEKILSIGKEG